MGVEVVLGKANALSCGWVYDCGLNIQQSPAGVSCSAKGCSQLQCCSHSSIPWAGGEHKGQTCRQRLGTESSGSDSKPGMPGRWILFPSLTTQGWVRGVWWGRTAGQSSKRKRRTNPRSAVAVWCQHLPGNLHQLGKAGIEMKHCKFTTNGQNHLPFHL